MAPITNVLCLYVFSLGLFVWSTGARESRFFNKEPAYDNPNGGSNNAGYGEGYTNSGVDNSYGAGSGNGYGSYRGQGNGNGYVYGDSDVSRFSSGDGRAGNGYRSGSGRAAEYFSQSAVGNDAGAGYKESSGKGSGYAAGAGYRGEAYGSGSGSGSGADWHGYNGGYAQGGDQYASGHGGRTESNGPYRSAYGSGYFTGSHNVLSDSQPPYMCNDQASTYADGSTFSSNLNRVMGDLVNNTPQTGFNTSSYGQNLNRIYGLLQCAGDISEQNCSTCSQKANETVRQLCPHKIGARLWLDNCYLRYENFNFSHLNTYLYKRLVNSSNINSGDINSFTTTTSNLLSNLSYEAYFTKKGFAQGSATYSVNGTVYGEVQCWRYLSITDCKSCLQIAINNVSDDYSMSRGALLGSCLVRYEIYPFLDTSSASPPPTSAPSGANPPTVAAPLANGTSSTMSNGFSSKTLPIIMGIVGGVLLVLMACLFAIWRKMKSSISERRGTRLQNEETRESDPEPTQLKQTQTLFTVEDLIEATDNFDKSKKVGQGGFGSVYKGTTRDGIEIAVKKLSVTSGQGKREFMNEVKLVANVQHRNLVKLFGCCAEGRERLLVYEYLPNKSLDSFLFDPEKKRHLDWHKRYNIITGIARGLLYLHQDSQLRIIHRDIKASNILLDERLNPKIADFGLARLFPEDETHIQTKAAGTYGYMAPEYAMRGQLSVKVDVYSFGVLVLEIVSARKNTELNFPDEMQSLLEWAWRLYNRGCLPDMIDSTLAETIRQEQALRCIHVALLCTQADAGLRPIMSNVILMISSARVTLANPTIPAFVKNSDSGHGGSTAGSSSSGIQQSRPSATASSVSPASTYSPLVPSINDVTISELDAR